MIFDNVCQPLSNIAIQNVPRRVIFLIRKKNSITVRFLITVRFCFNEITNLKK